MKFQQICSLEKHVLPNFFLGTELQTNQLISAAL